VIPAYIHAAALPAALALLPPEFDTPAARAMVLAIGLQETAFTRRRQFGGGPARGFWEFELAGVAGVLVDKHLAPMLTPALQQLRYPPAVHACYDALEHNDVLAALFARLDLWRYPDPLPGPADAAEGWRQYLAVWRPGKPRPNDWPAYFAAAWATVGVPA
jgi:hypothetical protein